MLVFQIVVSTGSRLIERGLVMVDKSKAGEELARIRAELHEQGWPEVTFD